MTEFLELLRKFETAVINNEQAKVRALRIAMQVHIMKLTEDGQQKILKLEQTRQQLAKRVRELESALDYYEDEGWSEPRMWGDL